MLEYAQLLVDNSPGRRWNGLSPARVLKSSEAGIVKRLGIALIDVHHMNIKLINTIKSIFSPIFTMIGIDTESAKSGGLEENRRYRRPRD